MQRTVWFSAQYMRVQASLTICAAVDCSGNIPDRSELPPAPSPRSCPLLITIPFSRFRAEEHFDMNWTRSSFSTNPLQSIQDAAVSIEETNAVIYFHNFSVASAVYVKAALHNWVNVHPLHHGIVFCICLLQQLVTGWGSELEGRNRRAAS
jgi:hypothetical protein